MSSTSIFYHNKQVATVIAGQQKRSIHRGSQIALAESQWGNDKTCGFLGTDSSGSILTATGSDSNETHNYSPYGNSSTVPSAKSMLGYNGERAEERPLYILGSGYRAFSTGLMRFLSPDNLSPFGKGGINPYAYCAGDPINYTDPTGHMPLARRPINKQYVQSLFKEKSIKQTKLQQHHQGIKDLTRQAETYRDKIVKNTDRWLANHATLKKDSKLMGRERMHPKDTAELRRQQDNIIAENVRLKNELGKILLQKDNTEKSKVVSRLEGELMFINDELSRANRILPASILNTWKRELESNTIRTNTA
ncbi:hypothetical protein B8W72_17135 [Pseudomonas putida]|uniref:RHS repeat-associated core domain-containing protein n=1 Tax=Pseudomonas putida TaxID=303 RepID=A0A1Y3L1L0_PSEPU|nr:RHS repeat-associated core domain-containing protein [Pseudomonas putida]OUM30501.1 hypothetical protein B8W72_17135 [Pseudomonas putida]